MTLPGAERVGGSGPGPAGLRGPYTGPAAGPVQTGTRRCPSKPTGWAGRLPTATHDHMTRTDEELVASATAGDLDSFNQLVARWERPIYALAYRTLGREEEARDVVQDAFLRAYRGLRGFKGEAKFSSWLYRITLNLCRDWMRRERRAPLVAVPEGVDAVDLADRQAAPTESVEDLVARREMSRAVARAMADLPEDQRAAVLLKEYHGLTFQEIADMLDCPLSTVKTRLYQGLSVLRRRLERQQAEDAALRRATWERTS